MIYQGTVFRMDREMIEMISKAETIPVRMQEELCQKGGNNIRRQLADRVDLAPTLEKEAVKEYETARYYISKPRKNRKALAKVLSFELSETDLIHLASQEVLDAKMVKKLIPKITPMSSWTLLGNITTPKEFSVSLTKKYIKHFRFRDHAGTKSLERIKLTPSGWAEVLNICCWFQIGVVRYVLDNVKDKEVRLAICNYLRKIERCEMGDWISFNEGEVVSKRDLLSDIDRLLEILCRDSFGEVEVIESISGLTIIDHQMPRAQKALMELKSSIEVKVVDCKKYLCEDSSCIKNLNELTQSGFAPREIIVSSLRSILAHKGMNLLNRKNAIAQLMGPRSRVLAVELIMAKEYDLLRELVIEAGSLVFLGIDQELILSAALILGNEGVEIDIEMLDQVEDKVQLANNFKPAYRILTNTKYLTYALVYIESLTVEERELMLVIWRNWEGSLKELVELNSQLLK